MLKVLLVLFWLFEFSGLCDFFVQDFRCAEDTVIMREMAPGANGFF